VSDFNVTFRVRNARLLRRIREKFGTAAEFCRQSGVAPQMVSALLSMRVRPIRKDGEWVEAAYKIAAYLRCDPEDIWPAYMREATMARNTAEIEMTAADAVAFLPGSEANAGRAALLQKWTRGLLPREIRAIEFIQSGSTLDDAAAEFGVTRERVRQIEIKTLRKMRRNALVMSGVRGMGDLA